MRRVSGGLAGALLGVAVLGFAAVGPARSDGPSAARSSGEDSPWPRTTSIPANVRAIRSVVAGLESQVELMEWSVARYASWQACIRGVPVSEFGDPDGRFGYVFDERDGSGSGRRPALAVDRTSRAGREDYLFLDFADDGSCRSDAPLPGGTADPAAVRRRSPAKLRGPALRRALRNAERRVRALRRSARRLLDASEHFDEWESCVSWVPVTEYGDPDGRFGYRFGGRDTPVPEYRPALAVDRSDWDDPDYMVLAFVGGDRPGRVCQDEPGEAVD